MSPSLPPAHAASYTHERTYGKLVGRLGGKTTPVWAQCLFVDPIADLAILGSPDNQELWEEAEAYDKIVEAAVPLAVAGIELVLEPRALPDGTTFRIQAPAECQGWLISLDRRWFRCHIYASSASVWIQDAAEPIEGGMSGSPIVTDEGMAIGVVSIAAGFVTDDGRELGRPREGGPNPNLGGNLPGWLLGELIRKRVPDECLP